MTTEWLERYSRQTLLKEVGGQGQRRQTLNHKKAHPVTTEWLERYSRQILLKEVGGQGQRRLGNAVVGIVGAGRMGTPLTLYLAAAGMGHLVIVDDDRPPPTHRAQETDTPQQQARHAPQKEGETPPPGQHTHPPPSQTTGRAASLSMATRPLNPLVTLTPLRMTLHPGNAMEHMRSWDLAVLACNHPETRETLNIAAQRTNTPLLSGWRAHGLYHVTASRAGGDPHAPCLLCATPTHASPRNPPTPSALLDMGAGVIGAILAMETLKACLDIGDGLWHTRLTFYPKEGIYRMTPTHQNPHCPVCRDHEHT